MLRGEQLNTAAILIKGVNTDSLAATPTANSHDTKF
jgi:hypothetical protein